MSTDIIVVQLGIITNQINRYAPIFLLLFAIIRNLLNCLVLTQRTLRTNPCSVYFLAANLLNLISFVTAFTPRTINGWNTGIDLSETVSALCQLVVFVIFTSRSMFAWFSTLASVDRYLVLSANNHRRQMSNIKNTYCCM
jgi:hypothetical protein